MFSSAVHQNRVHPHGTGAEIALFQVITYKHYLLRLQLQLASGEIRSQTKLSKIRPSFALQGSLLLRSQERYLGYFMSQFVFRTSFVYVTNQRLIVKKSKAWATTWFVHIFSAGVGGILLTSVGTLFGLGLILMAVAFVGAGLNRRERKKGRRFDLVKIDDKDIVLESSQILGVEMRPPRMFHGGCARIITMTHEPLKLSINSKKGFRTILSIINRFNSKLVKLVSD